MKDKLYNKEIVKNKKIINYREKGITLLALVVTIIILLILTGVTLNMGLSNNGIIVRAKQIAEETKKTTEEEYRRMAMFEAMVNTEITYFQNVPIPEGFAPTRIEGESTVDEGLVITDSQGNEFVWVPVPNAILDSRENFNATTNLNYTPMAMVNNAKNENGKVNYKGILYENWKISENTDKTVRDYR